MKLGKPHFLKDVRLNLRKAYDIDQNVIPGHTLRGPVENDEIIRVLTIESISEPEQHGTES
jgi:hypothetical protein